MRLSVEYLPEAELEVDAASRWYESQRRGLGLEFLLALDAAVSRLQGLPESHEVIAKRTRKTLLRRFPYLLLYVIEERRILVTAVFHARRDPQVWTDRVRDDAVLKLSWEDTAREVARTQEDWGIWAATVGDGVEDIPWEAST